MRREGSGKQASHKQGRYKSEHAWQILCELSKSSPHNQGVNAASIGVLIIFNLALIIIAMSLNCCDEGDVTFSAEPDASSL